MNTNTRLYYANQLVDEFEDRYPKLAQYLHTNWGLEVYNGGYLHVYDYGDVSTWYRPDLTPVLIQDVPKELILLELLYR